MATFDQGGGCSCGLKRECDCKPPIMPPERMTYDAFNEGIKLACEEIKAATVKLGETIDSLMKSAKESGLDPDVCVSILEKRADAHDAEMKILKDKRAGA